MFDPGKVGKYKSNVSDYVNAGMAGADALVKNFAVARRNAPDYQKLVQTSMKARSDERVAAIQAETKLRQTGMEAKSNIKGLEIETEGKIKGLEKKAGAKRMAGLVGAAGAVAVGVADGYMQKAENARQAKRDAENKAWWQEWFKNQRELHTETSTPYEREPNPHALSNDDEDDNGSTDSDESPETPATSNNDGSTETPPSTQAKLFVPNEDGIYTQGDMKNLGLDLGLSDDEATTFAAIGMAESHGRSGIDTVQSGLDTDQSNEFSVGLWQVNTQAHMDKLNRRGWTIEDLRDPQKNAEIAVEIYRERGNFEPWGAYTNGSYQQFL